MNTEKTSENIFMYMNIILQMEGESGFTRSIIDELHSSYNQQV